MNVLKRCLTNRPLTNRSKSSALVVLAGLFVLGACASGESRQGTMVPIGDVQSAAGRWSGIVESSGRRQDDFIDVIVNADGTYQTAGARTIGILEGRGRVEVQNGRLRVTGERVTGLGSLFEKDGRRTLIIEIVASNGGQYTARLTPK